MHDGRKLATVLMICAALVVVCQPGTKCLAQQTKPVATELREAPPVGAAPETSGKAEVAPATQPAPTEGPAQPKSILDMVKGNGMIFVLIGGMVLLYVWMGRNRRKQESKRKEMLANLKKGDKVTSIGGIALSLTCKRAVPASGTGMDS